jgi:hypothetical protein
MNRDIARISYYDDHIETSHLAAAKRRMKNKAEILDKLITSQVLIQSHTASIISRAI